MHKFAISKEKFNCEWYIKQNKDDVSVDKIWLDYYQKNVPHEINTQEYSSLVELFDSSCKKFASKISYVNFGVEITYMQLEQKANKLAIYLQQLGLKKGARVAIMMPNILQYPIAIFGILKAGCVVVNMNPLYTPDEVMYQVNDSGSETIIVLENFASTVAKALPRTSLKYIIVTKIGDVFPPFKRLLANFMSKNIKKLVPKYDLPQAINFYQILKDNYSKKLKNVSLENSDIAFLQYTGGTTGISKGAILTHGNMLANVLQAYAWLAPLKMNKQDIIVTALPLYHIFSLTANCLTFIKVGAKNYLITDPRNLNKFIATIKKIKFTAITGVNTLFNSLLNHPKFKYVDFSHLKLALSGGMALQKGVALLWKQVTHSPILEAYGLTEASPAVTMNPMYIVDYTGSIGLPLPSTDISIRSDEGLELGIKNPGELCVKGPQVMSGYWQKQDETDLVFTRDGFLKTGDIAYIDEHGFVYLVDRKKDMIDVSGFNVYPNEVEQVISMHPGVLEVGVAGFIHEDKQEIVKAWVVKRDAKLTKDEIINFCREHLTGYKVPKIIEFCDDLPKTNVGKVLRRALGQHEATVD